MNTTNELRNTGNWTGRTARVSSPGKWAHEVDRGRIPLRAWVGAAFFLIVLFGIVPAVGAIAGLIR